MKIFLTTALSLILISTAEAQVNLSTLYDQHWNLAGSKTIPSKLGLDFPTASVALANFHGYAGNSGFNLKTIRETNSSSVDKAISKMSGKNYLGVGADVDILAFSYKVTEKDDEKMSFSFFLTERAGFNMIYSRDFFDFFWNGNKKYEGKSADLTLRAGMQHLREYAVGWSMPISLPSFSNEAKIRIGARAKYLQGFGSLYMPSASSRLITGADGRSIQLLGTYEVQTAGFSNYSPTSSVGSGVGIDLSGTLQLNQNISASLGVLDIGQMKYSKDTKAYYMDKGFSYNGIPILDIIAGGDFNARNYLENEFKGRETSNNSYTTPLPTRVVLQGEYHTQATTKAKKREYQDKSVYLTYIQGLNNMPGSTVRPFISAGYVHSFNYVFSAGVNVGHGGYNRSFLGANASLRLGGVRLGVGSSNLLGSTTLNGSGMDLAFNLGFTF